MSNNKLDLNWELVAEARESAKKIVADSQVFIDSHSTVTVERTICRLLGIDDVDAFGVPLPNAVGDYVKNMEILPWESQNILGMLCWKQD